MKLKKVLIVVGFVCIFWSLTLQDVVCSGAVNEDYNILNSKEWFEDYIVDAASGLYIKKAGYSALEIVKVNRDNVYALYMPGGDNAHVVYYDETQKYMGGEVIAACRGEFIDLPDGCEYITISMAKSAIKESVLIEDGAREAYVVSQGGKTKYSSVKSAVAAIKGNGTILVMPGIYKGNVQAWGKVVNIIGVDRLNCIIENSSGAYSAPPLEIAAGRVSNVTIRATSPGNEGRGAGNTEPGAYGVHIEDNTLFNNLLVFTNCSIYSDYNSAVGMGMRGGGRVRFEDCHLKGKEFGLFCHDSAAKKYSGVQHLSLVNCVMEGMQGKYAVRFDSQGTTGATVNVLFVNNYLKNKKSDNLLSTRNNGGKGDLDNWMKLKNYYLDEGSIGNNISEMNY